MSTDLLLSKLDRVRQTGAGRWIACCPAHEDKGPSLAVRETDDGRVLLHCFAGCDVVDVLHAVGLTFDDLYPPRLVGHHIRPERRAFPAADVLRCVNQESLVIAAVGVAVANGAPLTEIDRERLVTAASRLQSAATLAGCAHG